MVWELTERGDIRQNCARHNLDMELRRLPSDPERTATNLLYALRIAESTGVELDTNQRTRAIRLLLHLVLEAGSYGNRFDEHQFLSTLDSLHGSDTAASMNAELAKSYYYSRREPGGADRERTIQKARRYCRTNSDLVYVAIASAQQCIDVDRYRDAGIILFQCYQLIVADQSCSGLLPNFYVCQGNLYYVQGRLRMAMRYFRMAVSLADRPNSAYNVRPTEKGHLYLGRIDSLFGRDELAVSHLMAANRVSTTRGHVDTRMAGYRHLRLGEILMAVGRRDEAEAHLRWSQELFRNVRERGTGQAHHNSAVSVLDVHAGLADRQTTGHRFGTLVDDAVRVARTNNYRRGVVVFEARRAWSAGKERRWGVALRSGSVAFRIGLALARNSGWRTAVCGALELAIAFAVRNVRRSAVIRRSARIECPCDDCRTRRLQCNESAGGTLERTVDRRV